LLCACFAAHQSQDRSRRRVAAADPVHAGDPLVRSAICRPLLADSRTFARDQRLAARIPAEDADPGIRLDDGAAGNFADHSFRGRIVRPSTMIMPLSEFLAVAMVAAVIGALMFGYPVALTLGGISLVFAGHGHFFGVMNFALLGALPARIFGVMTNDVLV